MANNPLFNRGDAQRTARPENAVLNPAQGITPKEKQHSMGASLVVPGGGAIITYAEAVEVAPLTDYAEPDDDSIASDTGGRAGVTHAAANPKPALKAIHSDASKAAKSTHPDWAAPKFTGLGVLTLPARNTYATPTPMPKAGYYEPVDAILEPVYAESVSVPLVAALCGSMPEADTEIQSTVYEVSDVDGKADYEVSYADGRVDYEISDADGKVDTSV